MVRPFLDSAAYCFTRSSGSYSHGPRFPYGSFGRFSRFCRGCFGLPGTQYPRGIMKLVVQAFPFFRFALNSWAV